jgi:DNA-binding HxlR family transcriptional regulator
VRSYGQFCALARALDVVGDRWTLLIARELAGGPCRFRDLTDGLPGIAPNLLSGRLRLMTAEGIIAHDDATATYQLTDRGRDLGDALKALVRWGIPLMARGRGSDQSRAHWLALAISALFEGTTLNPPVRVQILSGTDEIEIAAHRHAVEIRAGHALSPDATLQGPHELILGTLGGEISLAAAAKGGLAISGSKPALHRLIESRRLRMLLTVSAACQGSSSRAVGRATRPSHMNSPSRQRPSATAGVGCAAATLTAVELGLGTGIRLGSNTLSCDAGRGRGPGRGPGFRNILCAGSIPGRECCDLYR